MSRDDDPPGRDWPLPDGSAPRLGSGAALPGDDTPAPVEAVLDARLGRVVARKLLPPSPPAEAAARLTREARITAQLEHPAIVPVYDAGVTDEGAPWYTMRVVRGRSLEAAIEVAGGVEERLRLLRHVLDACEAVAFAHSVGVIHRDLKPANIMVGEFGETQVVDWGLARSTDEGEMGAAAAIEGGPLETVRGAVLGTPSFMAPEQARGEVADARSDVWGLGAVLYAVICGQPPFTGSSSQEVLDALLSQPPPPLAPRAPEAPPELVAIAERALSPDAAARYADARALAADVVRFLDGRRVAAYAYSSAELLRRLVRAWRTPLMAAGLALAAVGVVAGLAWQRTIVERDRALRAEGETRAALSEADANLASALIAQARAAAARGLRAETEVLAAHALRLREDPEARGLLAAFSGPGPALISSAPLPDCALPRISADGGLLLCGGEALSLWRLAPRERLWRVEIEHTEAALLGDGTALVHAADRIIWISPDGRRAGESALPDRNVPSRGLLGGGSGALGVFIHPYGGWLFPRGGGHRPLEWCSSGTGTWATALRGDDTLAVICFDGDLLVGPADGGPALRWPTPFKSADDQAVGAAAFSPDGERLVVGSRGGLVASIRLSDGATSTPVDAGLGPIIGAAVSPGGRLGAVTGERPGLRLVDLQAGALRDSLPSAGGGAPRFEGPRQLTLLGDRLDTWSLPEMTPRVLGAGSGVTGVATDPAGGRLAVVGAGGRMEVYALPGGALEADLGGGEQVNKAVTFTADGRHLYAVGALGLWGFRADTWAPLAGYPQPKRGGRRVGALADGTVFYTTFSETGARALGEGGASESIAGADARIWEAAVTPDRRAAALFGEGGAAWRLSVDAPRSLRPLGTWREGVALALSPDQSILAIGEERGVLLASLPGGEPLRRLDAGAGVVVDLAFSPDGRWLVAGGLHRVARIWRVEDGALVAIGRGHEQRVSSVTFDAAGERLYTGSWDGTVRIWGLADLETPAEALVDRAQSTWGLSLEEALSAP